MRVDILLSKAFPSGHLSLLLETSCFIILFHNHISLVTRFQNADSCQLINHESQSGNSPILIGMG